MLHVGDACISGGFLKKMVAGKVLVPSLGMQIICTHKKSILYHARQSRNMTRTLILIFKFEAHGLADQAQVFASLCDIRNNPCTYVHV